MEKLTSDQLENLQKKADKYINKTVIVPSSIFNAFGKKGKGDNIEVTLVGYTKAKYATKEKQQDEKAQVITFHMPNAKLKNNKGVIKNVSLDKVIECFENQENNQPS